MDFVDVSSILLVFSGDTENYTLVRYSETEGEPAHTIYDYKVVKNPGDGCTFHVEFQQAFLNRSDLTSGNIDIYYTGQLNQNAVIGGARDVMTPENSTGGNINESWLSYGKAAYTEPGHLETAHSFTHTYTWPVKIHKIAYVTTTADSEAKDAPKAEQVIGLSGAEFRLTSDIDGKNEIKFSVVYEKEDNGDYVYELNGDGTKKLDADGNPIKVIHSYRRDPNGDTKITTNLDGFITLEGLDSGTYYLWETKAPDGYQILSGSTTIVINNDGSIQQNNAKVDHIDVRNNAGSMMPTTGGMGTTLFYILGGILAVGAAVLLITKKRVNAGESI